MQMHIMLSAKTNCSLKCRQLRSAELDQQAIFLISSDHYPHAQPDKLMQIIQELQAVEQGVEFQAAMSSNIHALGQQTRSAVVIK